MAAFFFEIAHGRSGMQYSWMGLAAYFGSAIYPRAAADSSESPAGATFVVGVKVEGEDQRSAA